MNRMLIHGTVKPLSKTIGLFLVPDGYIVKTPLMMTMMRAILEETYYARTVLTGLVLHMEDQQQ